MINLCVLSMIHCADRAFELSSRGTQTQKVGFHEMSSKIVAVVFGPPLLEITEECLRVFDYRFFGLLPELTYSSKKLSGNVLCAASPLGFWRKIKGQHD